MRGIQFDAKSREAIIAGRKSQTRRVMKPQPVRSAGGVWDWRNYHWTAGADISYYASARCPYREVGDVLYVKERRYMAAAEASLFIRLTAIRIGRLQDISYEDILAEGWERLTGLPVCLWPLPKGTPKGLTYTEYEFAAGRFWYAARWDALNAKRGFPWDSNPWVFVLTFELAEGPKGEAQCGKAGWK